MLYLRLKMSDFRAKNQHLRQKVYFKPVLERYISHGVLAERIFGVANFLPVLPSADTRVYLKKNFRLKYLALIAQWYSVRLACEGTPDRSRPAPKIFFFNRA